MAKNQPWRVALTGGIACGKSTVAALFAQLGVPIIDLDELAREVVAPGTALLDEVFRRFGLRLRRGDGSLDRGALREIVFRDAQARRELEAMLHPSIEARAAQRSAAAAGPYQIVVVPLLAETQTARRYDRVLVVDCSAAKQRARLAARDGAGAELVQAALAAQAPREARLALADDIIVNDGAEATLQPRVRELHRLYLQRAAAHRAVPSSREGSRAQ